MKKVIGKIKLAPYVPAWYDAKNDLHLMRSKHRIEQDIHEDVDMGPINKGVKAGYIIFTEVKEEAKPKAVVKQEEAKEEAPKRKRKATPKKKEEVRIDVEVTTENNNDEGGQE